MTTTTRGVPWRESAAAAAVIALTAAATVALATGKVSEAVVADTGVLPAADWITFVSIVLRNGAVALGLFSGAVTLGVSTGVFLLLVGGMLGWSVAISVTALGPVETLVRCWAYTAPELLGFALAGAAGLGPVLGLLRRREQPPAGGTPPLARPGRGLADSLRTLLVSLAVLAVAAGIETASIGLTNLRAA